MPEKPRGNLVTVIGHDANGNLVPLLFDADGNLRVIVEGGVSMPNTLLDGVQHSDTELKSPTLGALIATRDIGGGVYRWTRLDPGSTGQILQVNLDGTIVWSSNLRDNDGWILSSLTWTRTSNTTFTVPGDYTATFRKGTRIKATQTVDRYFVVVLSAFAAGVTTVTVTAGNDDALAAATIVQGYYSYDTAPIDYPGTFNWTPGYTGFSANPTFDQSKFAVTGGVCTIFYNQSAPGTSNGTGFTITGLPVSSAVNVNNAALAIVENNSVLATNPGYISLSGTVITVHRDGLNTAWTNALLKGALIPAFQYTI